MSNAIAKTVLLLLLLFMNTIMFAQESQEYDTCCTTITATEIQNTAQEMAIRGADRLVIVLDLSQSMVDNQDRYQRALGIFRNRLRNLIQLPRTSDLRFNILAIGPSPSQMEEINTGSTIMYTIDDPSNTWRTNWSTTWSIYSLIENRPTLHNVHNSFEGLETLYNLLDPENSNTGNNLFNYNIGADDNGKNQTCIWEALELAIRLFENPEDKNYFLYIGDAVPNYSRFARGDPNDHLEAASFRVVEDLNSYRNLCNNYGNACQEMGSLLDNGATANFFDQTNVNNSFVFHGSMFNLDQINEFNGGEHTQHIYNFYFNRLGRIIIQLFDNDIIRTDLSGNRSVYGGAVVNNNDLRISNIDFMKQLTSSESLTIENPLCSSNGSDIEPERIYLNSYYDLKINIGYDNLNGDVIVLLGAETNDDQEPSSTIEISQQSFRLQLNEPIDIRSLLIPHKNKISEMLGGRNQKNNQYLTTISLIIGNRKCTKSIYLQPNLYDDNEGEYVNREPFSAKISNLNQSLDSIDLSDMGGERIDLGYENEENTHQILRAYYKLDGQIVFSDSTDYSINLPAELSFYDWLEYGIFDIFTGAKVSNHVIKSSFLSSNHRFHVDAEEEEFPKECTIESKYGLSSETQSFFIDYELKNTNGSFGNYMPDKATIRPRARFEKPITFLQLPQFIHFDASLYTDEENSSDKVFSKSDYWLMYPQFNLRWKDNRIHLHNTNNPEKENEEEKTDITFGNMDELDDLYTKIEADIPSIMLIDQNAFEKYKNLFSTQSEESGNEENNTNDEQVTVNKINTLILKAIQKISQPDESRNTNEESTKPYIAIDIATLDSINMSVTNTSKEAILNEALKDNNPLQTLEIELSIKRSDTYEELKKETNEITICNQDSSNSDNSPRLYELTDFKKEIKNTIESWIPLLKEDFINNSTKAGTTYEIILKLDPNNKIKERYVTDLIQNPEADNEWAYKFNIHNYTWSLSTALYLGVVDPFHIGIPNWITDVDFGATLSYSIWLNRKKFKKVRIWLHAGVGFMFYRFRMGQDNEDSGTYIDIREYEDPDSEDGEKLYPRISLRYLKIPLALSFIGSFKNNKNWLFEIKPAIDLALNIQAIIANKPLTEVTGQAIDDTYLIRLNANVGVAVNLHRKLSQIGKSMLFFFVGAHFDVTIINSLHSPNYSSEEESLSFFNEYENNMKRRIFDIGIQTGIYLSFPSIRDRKGNGN